MEKQDLSSRTNRLRAEVRRLDADLIAIELADVKRFPENYSEMTINAALKSERLTCSLRNLVYAGSGAKKAEYLSQAAVAQGVSIESTQNSIYITLPGQLSKRRPGHSSEFLVDPLFFALSEFTMATQFPKLERATVCFIHGYESAANVRDYDNIESKQVLDVIALFTLADDSGNCCDVYHTTQVGAAVTQVIVMPCEDFPTWLAAQSVPNNG